ncbi:MAG: branched-chain amino acid ABC transporter substrate-binding protein [Gammaproteobacteria bacterium]|nr:branched-chain amino acid ABC transporter substrate-binding protein [Gammaproteobacteria bacterium]
MRVRIISLAVSLLCSLAAHAEIHIAVVGPMTGQYAVFGEQMRRGMEMAVNDINANGGVLGQKLVLEVGDDACDPKQAVAIAKEVAAKKVVFVNGHYCSGSSIPASDVYNDHGVLQISPASTNPKFTERGLKNIFRVCGRDDQQGLVAGAYIAQHFKQVNVAILHDGDAYGKGLADETKKTLNRLGKKETLYETIAPGEKDYSAIVRKLKAANIGLIYFGGYHTEAGLIIRQAHSQGLKAVLMAGDALMTEEYWAITGAYGEGTLMTFNPDPMRNPAAKPVAEKFVQQGWRPEGYTLYAYGATQAWAQAAQTAGNAKVTDVAKVLKSGKRFDTVLGKIAFDANGDVKAPGFVVYEWKGGKYDYVQK